MGDTRVTLDTLLDTWERGLHPQKFNPSQAYRQAVTIIGDYPLSSDRLTQLIEKIPARSDSNNPHFNRAGIFISAIVNALSTEDSMVVVPIRKIAEHFRATQIPGYFARYGQKRALLDYLGFKHARGIAVYDGDAGYAAAADVNGGHVIFPGNVGTRAGWKQKAGSISILRNARHRLNEHQSGGDLLLAGSAGLKVDFRKTNGTTYILQNADRDAAQAMSGGELIIVKNVGAYYGKGMRGEARMHVGGNTGPYLVENRTGGHIELGPIISDQITKRYQQAIDILTNLGLTSHA